MEKHINTMGVLTSGGDAPGMNAVVRKALMNGVAVKGIKKDIKDF